MKLFYTKSSPYANCVRVVISELNIASQIEMHETHPFNDDADFLQANPLGKVPCLSENGENILDSEVICDFLDANFSGGTLFNPVYADWRLKTYYSMCSGLMDLLVARRMEQMRADDGIRSDFWWDRFNLGIARTLNQIETKLALLPAEFSILHINMMCCLAYLDFRHSDIDWRNDYPQLKAFFETYSSRPSFTDNPLLA
ncbi:glutathione S-transferase N-terminal domain-containing protein [Aliikangiella sp. IMCC44632]